MLILSRKPGERVRIGDDIWVEVRRVAGNRVTIAIEAPRDVHILRGELEPYADAFDDDGSREFAPSQSYQVRHYRVPRKPSVRAATA